MRSLQVVVLVMLMCGLAQAEAMRPATKRLPEWLDSLLRQADTSKIQWELMTLSVSDEPDAKQDQAKVEVLSPEKFWRLSPLVELRCGAANMHNVTPPGGPRKSSVDFEVALEVSEIREADLDRLKSASEELAKLADHLLADSSVNLLQLLASRPANITVFGHTVHRLPVRFALTGPRSAVLSRLSQMAIPLPFAYLRGLRATPGTELTVAVHLNLLVKPGAAGPAIGGSAEIAKAAGDKLTAAAGPDVKVTLSSAPTADPVILSVKGSARDVAAAKAALVAGVELPGLSAFDELGWKNDGGGVQVTGLLQFAGK